MPASPEALFAAVVAARPDAPLVTWYDERSGARVELSARSLANWAAKTAGLLGDELGLGPGDRVAIEPTGHWVLPGLLAGAWNAGVEVLTDPGAPADVAVVTAAGVAGVDADEILILDPTSPLLLGGPDPRGPDGRVARDLPTALRPHPDRPGPARAVSDEPALDGRARSVVVADALAAAGRRGLADGGRLLHAGGVPDAATVVEAVLAPWAVGGSLVLVVGEPGEERLAAIAAAEGVDVTS